MTAEALLKVTGLSCERDQRLLFQDLSFDLSAGEVLQIAGANGSGKTSLMRILTGLAEPLQGSIYWRGEGLNRPAVRADYLTHLTYLGHAAGIKTELTAIENLTWYARLDGREIKPELDGVLAALGLRGFEDVPCYTLSAGQQRRVGLARLGLLPTTLWVLDEPFTSIDDAGVVFIKQLIQQHCGDGGGVIMTSHQSLDDMPGLRRLRLGS